MGKLMFMPDCSASAVSALKFFVLFLLTILFVSSISVKAASAKPSAQISVMGLVYCDVCSNNSFSRHSYFLPGAEVRIDCNFRAASALTMEQITFSVNRTTDRRGIYRWDIASDDGMVCAEAALAFSCQASLLWSSSAGCNIPGHRATTEQIAFKSKRSNICIYSFKALNFRPLKRNPTLCGEQ